MPSIGLEWMQFLKYYIRNCKYDIFIDRPLECSCWVVRIVIKLQGKELPSDWACFSLLFSFYILVCDLYIGSRRGSRLKGAIRTRVKRS